MTNNNYLVNVFNSSNPLIQKYMQTSGIVPKADVLHSLKRFLKIDRNDEEATARDEKHIKGVKNVHADYIKATPLGYRKLTNNDIHVIKYDISNIHHEQTRKLHQLIKIVLSKQEVSKLKSLVPKQSKIAKKLGFSAK